MTFLAHCIFYLDHDKRNHYLTDTVQANQPIYLSRVKFPGFDSMSPCSAIIGDSDGDGYLNARGPGVEASDIMYFELEISVVKISP